MSDVQLKNTQGKLVSVPADQAKDALQNLGFSVPTQADFDQSFNQEKYGGVGEAAKAAGEGFVAGALPGGRYLLNKMGDTPEAQAGRKAANPIISGASELGGLGAGLVAGTGEEALAGDAAEAASGAGGLFGAAKTAVGAPTKAITTLGHAVTAGATPEAAGLAGRALGAGLGSAAEGAAYGLGQSIDDKALGDTDSIGENLLHNVGWSAVLGGGLGAIMSPFAKETSKAEKLFSEGASPMDAAIKEMPTEEQTGVIESLRKEKPNAAEIRQAAQDIGAPVLPVQVADSPHIQKLSEALEKRSDEVGIAYDNELRSAYKHGSDAVEGNLNNVEGSTPAEAGKTIREDLSDVIDSKYKPFQEAFDKIDQATGPISMAPEQADGIAKEMEQIITEKGLPKNREKARFIQDFADSVREASSARELDQLRSEILKEGREDFKLKALSGPMADILTQAREKLGTVAIKAMPEGEARIAAQQALDSIPVVKKAYGEFAQEVGRHGKALGFGKSVTPGEFLSKLSDEGRLSDEMITKKLMTKNDTGFLKFLQENAPTSFQTLMDQEKSRILNLAHKTGQFNAKAAIREIDKMSPEFRALVFKPEELRQIDSAGRYLKSFPKEYFTSNTATHANITEQFGGMTAAAGALMTGHPLIAAGAVAKHFFGNKLTSQAMKAAIDKLGPGAEGKVGALSMLEKMNGKFINQVASKSKALFEFDKQTAAAAAGSVMAKVLIHDDDKHQATSKQLTEYANNPEKLIDDLSKHTAPVYQYAPNVAAGLQKSTARAVSFLSSKLPKPPQTGPLGPKLKPSQFQKNIFSNYMNTIENPLHSLDKMKEGTLVPQDIEALSSVYPKNFQQMQQSVYSSMIDYVDKHGTDNIPKQTKAMISLFLGQDMDASLTPQSIAFNQAIFAQKSAQKDQQQAQQTARVSQKGLSSITKSQNLLTNAQQVSQRDIES
jgi:hypothetical protein